MARTFNPGNRTGTARRRNSALSPSPAARRTSVVWTIYYAVAREQMLDLQALQPHYLELGRIFRDNPVRRIILLTCNVGNADAFLNELSTDLSVPVVGYTERVISRRETRGRQTRVWMFLENDPPGQGSNNDQAATELLPGVDRSKVCTGRVIARAPARR